MEAQEIFDKVANHLLGMKRQSTNGQSCLYRDPQGNKCAVGCLIPDDIYSEDMENNTASQLLAAYPGTLDYLYPHKSLLMELQDIHDSGKWNRGKGGLNKAFLKKRLKETAKKFELGYSE